MAKRNTLDMLKNSASLSLLMGSLVGGVSTATATTLGHATSLGTGSAIRARAAQVSSGHLPQIALDKDSTEGKCGEGKCGEGKPEDKSKEGKCGEAKCGEGKCGDSSSGK